VTKRLVDRVDEELKGQVIHFAAVFEHRLKIGNKPIFHLEGMFTHVYLGMIAN